MWPAHSSPCLKTGASCADHCERQEPQEFEEDFRRAPSEYEYVPCEGDGCAEGDEDEDLLELGFRHDGGGLESDPEGV